MSDRSRTILDLDTNSAPTANVWLVIETSEGTNKVSLQNLLANSTANVTIANTKVLSYYLNVNRRKETPTTGTPANTPAGSWFYDDNYMYIATANNFLKKIPLTDF